jgi:hypothetical protein
MTSVRLLPPDPGDEDSFDQYHHYEFAHRRIPALFRGDPALQVLAMARMTPERLRDLWLENTIPELVDPQAVVGLACEVLSLPSGELIIVLFTLPKPWFTTGAHHVAAALLPATGGFGLWTLEKTVGEEDRAILGSWCQGTHLNLGSIGAPDREVFLEAVIARMDPALRGAPLVTDLRVEI